jgi:TolA-binding protein
MFSRTITLTRRLVFLGIIFLYAAAMAVGQIAGGLTETTNTRLGGNNYIVGTVFSPDGQPITIRMRLRLSSPSWGDILASTDDRGRFVFSGVGSGVYTIVIEGEEGFEPVSHQVEIIRERSTVPETYTVTIRLRAIENVKSKIKPGVVSAANAGVPKRALDLYQDAGKLAREKDYKGAIKQLKLAVDEYPSFLNALNQIGALYLRLDELDNADKALRAALKIDPESYDALISRAIILFRLTKFKDAETVLRKILKLKPESAAAHYYLGRTLNKLGRNNEAETAFLACIKISPTDFKEAHRILAAIYLDRGAAQRVVEELETYLKLVPTAPDADHLRRVVEQIKQPAPRPQPDHKP